MTTWKLILTGSKNFSNRFGTSQWWAQRWGGWLISHSRRRLRSGEFIEYSCMAESEVSNPAGWWALHFRMAFRRQPRTLIPCEWIRGGASALRRDAFESVGGFASFFKGSSPGEDLDLGYRLSRKWKVYYVPSAKCIHHQAPSGREEIRSAPVSFHAVTIWNSDNHDGEESLRALGSRRIVGAGPILE